MISCIGMKCETLVRLRTITGICLKFNPRLKMLGSDEDEMGWLDQHIESQLVFGNQLPRLFWYFVHIV